MSVATCTETGNAQRHNLETIRTVSRASVQKHDIDKNCKVAVPLDVSDQTYACNTSMPSFQTN